MKILIFHSGEFAYKLANLCVAVYQHPLPCCEIVHHMIDEYMPDLPSNQKFSLFFDMMNNIDDLKHLASMQAISKQNPTNN